MNATISPPTHPLASVGIGGLFGIRIIQTAEMREWYRKPRSKRRRIQEKWMARPENWRPRRDYIVDQVRGILYCHPIAYRGLAAAIREISMPNAQAEARHRMPLPPAAGSALCNGIEDGTPCSPMKIAIGRKPPTPPMGASNKGTRKHGGRANHGRPTSIKCNDPWHDSPTGQPDHKCPTCAPNVRDERQGVSPVRSSPLLAPLEENERKH